MKKFLLMLALILPMACCFTGCSSDDDEPEVTGLTEAEIQMFQGTWTLTKVEEFNLPGERKFLVNGQRIVVFQKLPTDANFEEVDSYTFKISGRTLVLTNEWTGEVGATVEILTLTSNSAKARLTDLEYGYGTYTMHLTKES